MFRLKLCLAIVTLLASTSTRVEAQGFAASISPSPEGNGMGGVSTMLSSDDALSPVANPAHLGRMAMKNTANISTYISSAENLPGWSMPDYSYRAFAVNAGLRLNDYLSLPLTIGLGLGYSRVNVDLGQFIVTKSSGPSVISTTHDIYDNSSNVTLGLGLEYILRVTAGVSLKWITSLPGTEQEPLTEITSQAWDYGLLIDLPVVRALEEITGASLSISPGLTPLLEPGFGYVRANVGDVEGDQSEPLSSKVAMGVDIELGLAWRTEERDWVLASFAVGREAEDWSHDPGSGDIGFWENVILGKTPENADLRRGWQVQFGELISIRGGSVDPRGQWIPVYKTSGFSVKTGGLMKLLGLVSPGLRQESWFHFIEGHIDIQYHQSSYEYEYGSEPTFSAVNLVLRKLPL